MDDIVEANNSDSNSSELSAFDKLKERQKKELKELQGNNNSKMEAIFS